MELCCYTCQISAKIYKLRNLQLLFKINFLFVPAHLHAHNRSHDNHSSACGIQEYLVSRPVLISEV